MNLLKLHQICSLSSTNLFIVRQRELLEKTEFIDEQRDKTSFKTIQDFFVIYLLFKTITNNFGKNRKYACICVKLENLYLCKLIIGL